jgi:flagellar M-ring protein FliF
MANVLFEVSSQAKEVSQALSAPQKISLMIVVSALMGGIILAGIWSKTPSYKPIYSGISGENVAEVVALLENEKIPYKLSSDGTGISVPSEKVAAVRLMMSGDGVLMGGGAGFELFDGKNIGMTEFMQKLNYQRALQGELARTISQLTEVEQARVHIVMPKESLFKEKEAEASASVVVKLKRGKMLRQSQVNGISELVANAVEGMETEGVSVIDSKGNVLTSGRKDGISYGASNNIEIQQAFEKEMQKKVTSMLDKAVGRGKSIVRVSAVMDFERSEKVEELFDPDSVVVRSEQRSVESYNDTEGVPRGTPGVKANILSGGEEAAAASSNSSKKNETINYEVSRTTKTTVSPLGELKSLSVAVLIDGTYETAEGGETKYIPRSEGELKTYETLLKRVVGFNVERGDELEVASVPFETVEGGAEMALFEATGDSKQFWISIAKNISFVLVALIFFIFVIRPLVKWVVTPVEGGLLLEGAPKTVREMEAALAGGGGAAEREMEAALAGGERSAEKELQIDNSLSSAKSNPDIVHSVIRGWIED